MKEEGEKKEAVKEDEATEEDVAFIEVSTSERKYPDLHYPETGINQNDRME